MPEGHSIHRYARLHRDMLGGRTVAAWSPQGRFDAGAATIDGATLVDVEAQGKHLFYRFGLPGPLRTERSSCGAAVSRFDRFAGDASDITLHVHLGLFGRFRHCSADPAPPTPGTRLVLAAAQTQVRLAGATACELVDPATETALRARLGPDPLHDEDPSRAFAALRRRTVGIGQALLDQRVIAGIGNVYRAEVLFLAGIHPDRPARGIDRGQFDDLWKTLRTLMTAGERNGRIITIQPVDRARPPSRLRADERLYVYQRAGQPCRRCGTSIRSWDLAARTMYACPTCQPS
jgi:formamidopyrimidine-DNA glycosylase